MTVHLDTVLDAARVPIYRAETSKVLKWVQDNPSPFPREVRIGKTNEIVDAEDYLNQAKYNMILDLVRRAMAQQDAYTSIGTGHRSEESERYAQTITRKIADQIR